MTELKPYLPSRQSNHIIEISKKVGALILAVRRRHTEVRWFKATSQGMNKTELREIGKEWVYDLQRK